MKILFAIHGPADPHTAVYLNTQQRAGYLRAAGHHVDIVTSDDLRPFNLRRLDPLLLPIALARRVAAYDVVLFHSYLGWAFHQLQGVLDGQRRVTTITAFHGLEPLYHAAVGPELNADGQPPSLGFRLLHHVVLPRLLRASCRASDAVFCLNTAEAEYLEQQKWSDAWRIAIVANGIEEEFFLDVDRAPDPSRLLFVGQWLAAKGRRYLVEAFVSLAAARRELTLTCAGTGATESSVRASFPASIHDRVFVKPRLDRAGIVNELRAADIFVFPSLSEGSSGAVLEAMAAGLPIVATPAGASADMLDDGRTALIVPFRNPGATAAAVARLLDDPALRTRVGRAAQIDARRYTWNDVNREYAAHLMAAVSAPAPVGAHESIDPNVTR
jgi:glycosyltransferase involved in cell wall biosynthesis